MKELKKYVNEIWNEKDLCELLEITNEELQSLFSISEKNEKISASIKMVVDTLYNPYNER